MSDPIRWLEDGTDASADERALLSSGRNMDPPPGAQDKIWATLQLHLGPAPGGGTGGSAPGNAATNGSIGSGSSGTSISAVAGGIKGVVVGIASITTIAGVIAAMVTTPAPPSKIDAPKPPVVVEIPAAIPEKAPEPELVNGVQGPPEVITPKTPSAALPEDPQPNQVPAPRVSTAKPTGRETEPAVDEATQARQERASRLRDENRILGDARTALRSGNSESALEKLEAMGGQFPDGVLVQEREVLVIEALAKAGKRAEASSRAAAFLRTYPTSPHAAKMRGFVE